MGGLVLPAVDDPRARRAADVPRERAGRAPGLGHRAASGAACAGVRKLARLAPALAACACAQDAALRRRYARLRIHTTHRGTYALFITFISTGYERTFEM